MRLEIGWIHFERFFERRNRFIQSPLLSVNDTHPGVDLVGGCDFLPKCRPVNLQGPVRLLALLVNLSQQVVNHRIRGILFTSLLQQPDTLLGRPFVFS